MPKFRTAYKRLLTRSLALACKDESLALQSEEPSCNINNLMDRYVTTGMIPVLDRAALKGDFADVSYQDMHDMVVEGRETFMALPADVRKRFDNDPGRFIAFVSDDSNLDEMRKLGLAIPKVEPPPAEVRS